MSQEAPLSYADAGVHIDAQNEALARAKASIRASFTPGVVGDIGLFGGLFDPARVGCDGKILVASADGVGTKLEVAKRAGIFDTVGRDLVQHCINDILVQGARPLFFLDYVGVGKLDPRIVSELIRGCAEACREGGLALLGGETAEMPGLYAPGDFDLVGFIVGAVAPEHLLDGSRVRAGDVLLGLESSGLHTNGYSLARKILFEREGFSIDDRPARLGGRSVGEALLAVHRSYLTQLLPLIEDRRLSALAHITGGGLLDNVPRVLGGRRAVIDLDAWTPPPIFQLLCESGRLERDEAYRVFNMGIGMVCLLAPEDENEVRRRLESMGERVHRIGHVEDAAPGEGGVVWAR